MRSPVAVLLWAFITGCLAQESAESTSGPALPAAASASLSSVLTSLSSWFSGVSDKLYSTVATNLGDDIDLAAISSKVTDLMPQFDYAPNHVISENKELGYEIRHYPSQRWACTEEPVIVEPVEPEGVQWNRTRLMFDRLFQYFAGENSRDEKIQMTLPLTNRFDAYSEEPSYNMCFYLPKAMQTNPPTPNNPFVTLTTWPAKTFVARKFGGFVLYRRGWDRAAFHLEKIVRDEGLQGIDFTKYYSVNYDPLVKFWSRHNEVWFEITG